MKKFMQYFCACLLVILPVSFITVEGLSFLHTECFAMGPGKLIQMAGGNPYVLVDSNAEGASVYQWHSSVGFADDFSGQWTTSTAYTIRRFCIYLDKISTPTGTLTGKIYSNNATPTPDEPGTLLGTSTNTITAASITNCTCGTDCDSYCFDFSGISLSGSTLYNFVLDSSVSETATIGTCINGAGLSAYGIVGSPWTNYGWTDFMMGFETYE